MSATPESRVLADVRAWLSLHNVPHWRINTAGTPLHDGSGRYRPAPQRGISDVLGILPGGVFLAVEVKAPKGKLSEDQRRFLLDVKEAGGVGIYVRGVEDLSEQLLPYVEGRLT